MTNETKKAASAAFSLSDFAIYNDINIAPKNTLIVRSFHDTMRSLLCRYAWNIMTKTINTHPIAPHLLAEETRRIALLCERTGAQAYLVGGAVRDLLMGKPAHDRDYVIVGSSDEALLAKGLLRIGKDFPVFLDPRDPDKCEIALARIERKQGQGYNGFVTETAGVSLKQDLSRRDLTINAMALDSDGNLVDPFNGVADIQHQTLRHVSDAFAEDPLRVLRVARFSARYGYTVAPDTLALCQQLAKQGELSTLVSERVWKELSRALMEDAPEQFIRTLRDCGALQTVLPEVDALFGVPQTAKHHPEVDTGEHILLCLARSAALNTSLAVRYAVLVHDLGKGITPTAILPKHHGHEEACVPLVQAVNARWRVPKAIGKLALFVCRNHLIAHRAFELTASRMCQLFEQAGGAHSNSMLPDFLLATQCDAQGRLGLTEEPYPAAPFLLAAWEAFKAVDTKACVYEGNPEKTQNAIHLARINALKPFTTTLSDLRTEYQKT